VHGDKCTPGQLVWLCNPVVPKGKSKKLLAPGVGPYKVVKCLSDVVYRIQDTRTSRKRQVVHFNCLKPCHEGVWIQGKEECLRKQASSLHHTSRLPPPGTALQIVEDDGTESQELPEMINMPNTSGQTQRQYPLRTNRRKPSRYTDD